MRIDRRWLLILAVAVASALKVGLTVTTYGTNDALTWEANVEKMRGEGGLALYRDGVDIPLRGGERYSNQRFSHPPSMIRLLSVWGSFTDSTGIPLGVWIRLTDILADIFSIILLFRILSRPGLPNPEANLAPAELAEGSLSDFGADTPATQSPLRIGSILLVTLSPISILISGFHVNTDPIMICFVLLSVYLVQRRAPIWLAGCALGLAINIKIIPILFIPAVCLYLRDWKKAAAFSGGIGITLVAGSLPEIYQDPLLIWNCLSGYPSTPRIWGTSRLSWALLPGNLYQAYLHSMKELMLLALLGFSVWMNVKKSVPLILQIAGLAFLFLVLTPGFGVQYLVWIAPWTALLPVRQAAIFHALSGVFLFTFYHRASQGTWYLANTLETPVWGGLVVYLGLFLWLWICVVTFTLGAHIRRERYRPSAP